MSRASNQKGIFPDETDPSDERVKRSASLCPYTNLSLPSEGQRASVELGFGMIQQWNAVCNPSVYSPLPYSLLFVK